MPVQALPRTLRTLILVLGLFMITLAGAMESVETAAAAEPATQSTQASKS